MNSSRIFRGAAALILAVCPSVAMAADATPSREIPPFDVGNLHDVIAHHPAAAELSRIFSDQPATVPASFKSTGMTRQDYLPLIAGDVDFWKKYQNDAGAIVDPYEKKERQYSTPAFALAAALLVQEAGRQDLLDPATRAMTFATTALEKKTSADGHADFYIPMLMHARRILKSRVSSEVAAKWDEQFKSLIPEKTYRDIAARGNWNLVNVSGELIRRKDGLVASDQMDAQAVYLQRCLKTQETQFTQFGMYEDPNAPLAYDAFPRLWAEDALADGAFYDKDLHDWYERDLALGSFSGLLLLSPSGEWPCGGRSAQHQWNEAENAEIDEINAAKWHARGRDDVAGAFKRAAHLALTSMKRWVRPTGEMWIVKNFAEPSRRFGFEGYSFNSQYNLLPMAMLAIAYERADESVAEAPMPSESAAYVFDLRDFFHHAVAAAGGTYVLIDTSADPHYGATGLQRVHKAGVALSPLTDSSAAERVLGPTDEKTKAALSPGIQWQDAGGAWRSLGEFGIHQYQNAPSRKGQPLLPAQKNYMDRVELKNVEQSADRVAFTIHYEPAGDGARPVEEDYVVTSTGVEGATRILGQAPAACRIVFPALVNDGAKDTDLEISGNTLRVRRTGGSLTWTVTASENLKLALTGPKLLTHNGYVRAVAADLPANVHEVKWKITLEP